MNTTDPQHDARRRVHRAWYVLGSAAILLTIALPLWWITGAWLLSWPTPGRGEIVIFALSWPLQMLWFWFHQRKAGNP